MENEKKFDKIKYNNDFNTMKYDRIGLMIPKGKKAKLQEYCKIQGISVNKLLNDFIDTLPIE